MGGGGGYNSRRNRKAVLAVIPEKRGVVDDWNDLLKEEKMIAREKATGRCGRCNQVLPLTRMGINRRPIDEYGFRVISP